MSDLTTLANHELWSTLGLVLLHFLWQGTLAALLVGAAARALGSAAARERYALFCVGLGALPLFPLATWAYLAEGSPAGAVAGGAVGGAPLAGLDAYAVCGWLWLAGALAFQLRLAVAWFRAHQLRRVGTELLEPAWQAELRALGERLGLRRAVRVYASARVEVPALVGWLEPVVLVPTAALAQLTPDQLRAVLAHELAHLARLDPWINALQSVIESLLFFHPAVWWLSARIREEREYCCDDLALEVVRDPLGYARALASLESLRRQESALVLSSHGGSLMQRIRRITSRPPGAHGRRPLRLAPLVVSGLVLSLAAGSAHGWISSESSEAEPTSPSAHDGHGGQAEHDARADLEGRLAELERLQRRVLQVRRQLEALEAELASKAGSPPYLQDLPLLQRTFQESLSRSRDRDVRRERSERQRKERANARAEEFDAALRRTFDRQVPDPNAQEYQEALRRTFEQQRRAYQRQQERDDRRAVERDEALRRLREDRERNRREASRSSLWPGTEGRRLPQLEAGARDRRDALLPEAGSPGRTPLLFDARFPASGGVPAPRDGARAPGAGAAPQPGVGAAPRPGVGAVPGPGVGAGVPVDPRADARVRWLEAYNGSAPEAGRRLPSLRAGTPAPTPEWPEPGVGVDAKSWLEGARLNRGRAPALRGLDVGAPAPSEGTDAPPRVWGEPRRSWGQPAPAPEAGAEPPRAWWGEPHRVWGEPAPEPEASDALRETRRLREEVRRLRAELEARSTSRVTDPRSNVGVPVDLQDVTEGVDLSDATGGVERLDLHRGVDLTDVTGGVQRLDLTEGVVRTDATGGVARLDLADGFGRAGASGGLRRLDLADGVGGTAGTGGVERLDLTEGVQLVDVTESVDLADVNEGVDLLDVTEGVDLSDLTEGVDFTDEPLESDLTDVTEGGETGGR